ncbi:Mo-dependent nitrogenase C-terminal domain-containing protein [Anabaena sp. CCY 0017]|uniref:Mo-dependent nitrogenase C-terminal domain-containing protein n=1 Tax=Anabaena sp. CCY 0017 TaxID=3103866 RepID=UPI0039C66A99
MTTALKSPYSSEQITAWLRGLLTIAWADGNFDPEEQELITSLTQEELALGIELDSLELITPEELAAKLGKRTPAAENFTRTAVMVAIANGTYSPSEDQVMQQLYRALEQPQDTLESLRHTLAPAEQVSSLAAPEEAPPQESLCSLRDWLDELEIHDPRVARFLCRMIPSQCPFERDITLFGRKIVHIPPLCQINPLYEQLVGLRFRALSYLADECGEDISPYI